MEKSICLSIYLAIKRGEIMSFVIHSSLLSTFLLSSVVLRSCIILLSNQLITISQEDSFHFYNPQYAGLKFSNKIPHWRSYCYCKCHQILSSDEIFLFSKIAFRKISELIDLTFLCNGLVAQQMSAYSKCSNETFPGLGCWGIDLISPHFTPVVGHNRNNTNSVFWVRLGQFWSFKRNVQIKIDALCTALLTATHSFF